MNDASCFATEIVVAGARGLVVGVNAVGKRVKVPGAEMNVLNLDFAHREMLAFEEPAKVTL